MFKANRQNDPAIVVEHVQQQLNGFIRFVLSTQRYRMELCVYGPSIVPSVTVLDVVPDEVIESGLLSSIKRKTIDAYLEYKNPFMNPLKKRLVTWVLASDCYKPIKLLTAYLLT